MALVILEWGFFNLLGRYPVSPTRHAIVLTPLMVLLIVIGFNHLHERISLSFRLKEAGAVTLVASIVVMFSAGYGKFRADRKDKFEQPLMEEYLAENGLDTIVGYAGSWSPALMFRNPKKPVTFVDMDAIWKKGPRSKLALPDKPFLLVSHQGPIEKFPRFSQLLERSRFRIRKIAEFSSDTEMQLSRDIKFGTNGLFVSVAEKVN
jgi:hypothetical protein